MGKKKNMRNFVLYCRDLGVFQISDLEVRRRIGGLVSCRKYRLQVAIFVKIPLIECRKLGSVFAK